MCGAWGRWKMGIKLCNFLPTSVPSTYLDTNILLSSLLSNNLNVPQPILYSLGDKPSLNPLWNTLRNYWCTLQPIPITLLKGKYHSYTTDQEIPHFYETRRFSSVLKRVSHWTIYWDSWIQSIPSYPRLRSILILSSSLHLGLKCSMHDSPLL
jgi:hypothetical protein